MEQLSIKEKAKAYDEAIERAKKCLKDGTITNTAKSYIEEIFPELAESQDEKIRKEIVRFIQMEVEDEMVGNKWLAWLEKQGEHKSSDKVEPKFKVGDWIILTAGELSTTLQIVNVDTNKKLYCFNDSSYLPIVNEECLHLWSIQDAKDGDVLNFVDHERDVIGIVSFVSKRTGKVDVSCLLEDNEFKIGNFYALDTIDPHPATKEQRDLLFQKMKEAGYGWDAEKKELLL